ncbi:Protein TolB [uncultured archaeon]|nr:Protein TolB [uncultured archaeon]
MTLPLDFKSPQSSQSIAAMIFAPFAFLPIRVHANPKSDHRTLTLILSALVLTTSTPVIALEDNHIRIDNVTSISSIVNPVMLDLARSVNAAPERRNFIPPQAFWSPDGSKLLISSMIGWYPGDIDFRPANRNGIGAIYIMDADGTNLTKIISNEINNRSSPISLSIPLYWSPSGDRIAIYARRSRMGGFYMLANPDGTQLRPIGTNFSDMVSIFTNLSGTQNQQDFAWSPDGTKAVFVTSQKIYTVDAGGSDMKQLASDVNEPYITGVTWSYDGKRIAFSGKNLWIMNSNGTDIRLFSACRSGIWSPDDSKILCISSEEANDQFLSVLYLINVNSGNKTELIKSVELGDPVWSPDGNSILFKSFTERKNHGIYVSDSLGRNVKLIYDENSSLDAISWNPGGNKIAFASLENGVSLYTINPDGTGKTLLTSNLSWSWTNPYAWSPSGDKIAFSSNTGNGEHIFIADPDGTGLTQITTGENKGYRLSGAGSWSPDGRRLLIESIGGRSWQREVFIVTLSGYDSTIFKRAPVVATQDVRPANNSITIKEPQAGQTDVPIVMSDTPQLPGFDMMFAAEILSAIYLIKRRYY